MKLKNRWWSIVLLLSCWWMVACSDDDSSGVDFQIKASETMLWMPTVGGDVSFQLEAASAWQSSVSEGGEWLTVSPENGAAGQAITITLKAGAVGKNEKNSAVVTFSLIEDRGKMVQVTVERGEPKPGRKTDSLALVSLYNATGGGKDWKIRWNLQKNMKSWEGLVFEEINGEQRVTEIILEKQGLVGQLPENLKYISELKFLNVEQNALTGEFPLFLCELKNIRMIDICENQFSGELSSKIFDHPTLEYLVIYTNGFSGTFPTNVGNCKTLIALLISDNKFVGTLPSSISQLTHLRDLWAAGNRFTGKIPDIEALRELRVLDLSRNGEFESINYILPSGVPDPNGAITLRKYVKGGFEGSSPVFHDLPNLETVWLHQNNLTSSPVFQNCPKMKHFYIYNNPIQRLDASVGKLKGLTHLYVYSCGLKELPSLQLDTLKFFLAQDNQLTSLPDLSALKQVEEVLVYKNKLTALPAMKTWEKLRFLMAYDNQLESLPADFWKSLNTAYSLMLSCNKIQGELPSDLLQLGYRNIEYLDIDCNQFTGSLTGLATAYTLKEIHASQNKFSGSLPSFSKMEKLSVLTLDDNNLSGTIPEDLVSSTCPLKHLHLFNNQLTGSVPSKLFKHSRWSDWNASTNILPQKNNVTLTLPN
ncbi:MAG: leucine-rich repeat domain-containing protein [Odoribacter sp.]